MLDLPLVSTLEKNIDEEQLEIVEKLWSGLWAAYTRNKGSTSLIYWTEKLGCSNAMNKVLIILKDYITADVIPERNWAQVSLNENKLLTIFTQEALIDYRADLKFENYLLRFKTSAKDSLVKHKGKISKTGLVREGFMKSGHTQYYYDTEMLLRHRDEVIKNTNKGMTKVRQTHKNIVVNEASYDVVSEKIVDHLSKNPELFTQGISYIDSRGRAIKESLKYVANPIGYKDFRSLLTIPE
jgi:hypothetical protein